MLSQNESGIVDDFTAAIEQRLKEDRNLLGHRHDLDGYDFSVIDKGIPRRVEVLFPRPNSRLYDASLKEIVGEFSHFTGELHDALVQRYKDIYRDHFATGKSWYKEQNHGNITAFFGEVSSDDTAPEVFPVKINNVQLVVKDSGFSLQEHFAEAVDLCQAFNGLKNDGLTRLNQKIYLEGEGVMSIHGDGCLRVGKQFWEGAKGQEQDFASLIMKHERGHFLHGDCNMDVYYVVAQKKLEKAVTPIALFQSLAAPSQHLKDPDAEEKQAEFRRAVAHLYPHPVAIEGLFNTLDNALTEMTPAISKLAQRIEAYPGFEQMDAFDIIKDRIGENAYGKYLVLMKEWEKIPAESAVSKFQSEVWQAAKGKLEPVTPEMDRLIAGKLDALRDKHAVLYDHLITLDSCVTDLSYAQEIRADLHMVEYADNVDNADAALRRFAELNKDKAHIDGRHHPSYHSRLEMTGSFKESVKQARAENAAKGRGK